MPNIITITLDAETGKLTTAMKGVDSSVKKTKRSTMDFVKAHKVAIVGLAASTAVLVKSIKSVVSAAMQQELVQTKLATAMKAGSTFTKQGYEELIRYAQELSNLTGFGDEAIIAVEAMLATFKLSPDIIKKATQATLDMASATGSDLQQAAILMGKAAVGETGTLSRYGIIVDEVALKTKGFQAVLDELETEFGGMAIATGATFQGQVRKLGATWGDFKEELGFILTTSPAVRDALGSIGKALVWMTGKVNTVVKVVQTWATITSFQVSLVWEIYSWLWDRLKWFFGNFGRGFMVIQQGLADFGKWLDGWAKFALSKLTFWTEEDIQPPPLGEIWQAEFNKVWKPFEEEGLQERIAPLGVALQEMLAEIWATSEEGTQAVAEANRATIQQASDATKTGAQKVAENLKRSVADTTTFISNLFIGFASGTGQAFADLIVDGKNLGESMKEVFKGLIKSAIAYIVKLLIIKALTRALGFPFEKGGEVPKFKAGGMIPKFQAGGEVPIIAHVGEYIIPADMVRRIRRQRELPLGLLSGIMTGSPPRMQAGGMVSPGVDVGGININVTALPEEPTESILDRLSQAVEEGVTSAVTFSKYTFNAGQRLAGEAV